ncbi:condensation domain-containing protein [Prescottella defluvii]|nr:condensation domain-containing protein [Prescottella defluvii]
MEVRQGHSSSFGQIPTATRRRSWTRTIAGSSNWSRNSCSRRRRRRSPTSTPRVRSSAPSCCGPPRSSKFWSRELEGLPDILSLPSDRPRPARRALDGGRVEFAISPDSHRVLVELARQRGCTTFAAVHAALVVLLARLADVDDIAVGTPSSGKASPGRSSTRWPCGPGCAKE